MSFDRLDTIQKQASKDNSKIEDLEKLNLKQQAELVGILNMEDFEKLPTIGKPILLDSKKEVKENQIINEDNLALVKAFNHDFDESEGCIKSNFEIGVSGRMSLHFSLNHLVVSHEGGDWANAKKAVIIPFDQMVKINGEPRAINSIDTYWRAEKIKFPKETVVIAISDKINEDNNKTESAVIKCNGQQSLDSVISVVLRKLGYTDIKGGRLYDSSCLDPLLGKLLEKHKASSELHIFDCNGRALDEINMIQLAVSSLEKDKELFNGNAKLIDKFIEGIGYLKSHLHLLNSEKQETILNYINKIILDSPDNLIHPKNEDDPLWFVELCFFDILSADLAEFSDLIKNSEDELVKKSAIDGISGLDKKRNIIKIIKSLSEHIIEKYLNKYLPLANGKVEYLKLSRVMNKAKNILLFKDNKNILLKADEIYYNKEYLKQLSESAIKLISYCKA